MDPIAKLAQLGIFFIQKPKDHSVKEVGRFGQDLTQILEGLQIPVQRRPTTAKPKWRRPKRRGLRA